MRVLIVLVVLLIVSCALPAADGLTAVVTLRPDFCWGGGITPQLPPGFCWGGGIIIGPFIVVDPTTGVRGAWITGWTDAGGESGTITESAGGGTATGSSAGSEAPPAQAAAQAPASQMYIPPAVWEWVAAHPVRAR